VPAAAPVVHVSGIRKAYGSTVAVDEVSFDVREGEIFGLIGPNGAGKTTTMECVEGLRTPDRGTIAVLGLDPVKHARALQNRMGVQLQQAQLQKRIKVWEAVDLWASLYPRTVNGDALLERLGLSDKRNAWFMTLSGGQKQRLFIALALINDPEVVLLDELTTGLDPQARRTIWDMVRGIRERGKTVLLTTHLMEEAERLCDRVAIIERGRVIDVGTPDGLVRRHCPEQTVVLSTPDPAARSYFAAVAGLESRRRIAHVVEQVLLHAGLVHDDVRELRQVVLGVLDPTGALDPRAICLGRAPEDGLVHPVGLADELLAQAEGVERLDRAAGDAVGLAHLERAVAPLDESRRDAWESRQLCRQQRARRTAANDEDVDGAGQLLRAHVGVAGLEAIQIELHIPSRLLRRARCSMISAVPGLQFF